MRGGSIRHPIGSASGSRECIFRRDVMSSALPISGPRRSEVRIPSSLESLGSTQNLIGQRKGEASPIILRDRHPNESKVAFVGCRRWRQRTSAIKVNGSS